MANLPAHISPTPHALPTSAQPVNSVQLPPTSHPYDIARANTASETNSISDGDNATTAVPPIVSPPATPGGTIPHTHISHPKLIERLPEVECIVRARIPTTTGAEMFLHLYHNDIDKKEHLAIVFGNTIRSRSLDRVRPGECERDRMIRGAYVGKLHPGRESSWYENPAQRGTTGNDEGGAVHESEVISERPSEAPLVRIHSECYTGETAWSARCDCGEQLDEAARLMSLPMGTLNEIASQQSRTVPNNVSGGVIIYLRQEGRGIGLGEKLKAYNLQDLGNDTVEANLALNHPADDRSYGLATAMLVDLGLGVDTNPHGIRLLTNNPDKIRAVEGPGREVVVKERVPMVPLSWQSGGKMGFTSSEVEGYLRTKISKMGHMIR
ncbi:GTP cyclohydrolase II-domain-containing protein [Aspergillus insuetus]